MRVDVIDVVLTWSFDFILFVQKLVSADYRIRVCSLAIDYCSVCSFSVPLICFSTVSFVWSKPLVRWQDFASSYLFLLALSSKMRTWLSID